MITNAHYMTILDASSDYHSLKPLTKSSYLTNFVYQFGMYISRKGVQPDPKNLHALTEMSLIIKKKYYHF